MDGADPTRNVRPRLGDAAGRPPENGGGASADAAAAPAVTSPLVAILEAAVARGRVVKEPHGQVYTGFASFSELANSACVFTPMNSNRAINRDVVRQRVEENVEAFDQTGSYLEFGQVNLIVMASDPSHEFLVMDGQHRCETMKELYRSHPDRHLTFQFRAKVVPTEARAFDELRHFQKAYPTDVRSFFSSRAEATVATAVLVQLKSFHAEAFHKMLLADRHGRPTSDPPRPLLNDNLVFWLLQDGGLLTSASGTDQPSTTRNAASVLSLVARMNALLPTLPVTELGEGATQKMRDKASRWNCWLGFFRQDKLHWRDLEDRLPPEPASASSAAPSVPSASSDGASSGARTNGSASAAPAAVAVPNGASTECALCLEEQPTMAFIPCGHRCVCAVCAGAVLRPPPPATPQCPLCRAAVNSAQRVYI